MIRLLPRLRAFARSLARAPDQADDLVQTTCLRALDRIAQFTPGTRLDSWLYRIMRNIWIDEHRRRKPVLSIVEAPWAEDVTGEDGRDTTETRLTLGEVGEVVAGMPEEQRSVLILVCVEGMKYREVAEILRHTHRHGDEPAVTGTADRGRGDGCGGGRGRGRTGNRKGTVMTERVSDDMLMALADGELDPETAADLQAQLAADPVLRRRYDRFLRSAEAVRGLFADTLADAPPEHLVAALRPAPAPEVSRLRSWSTGALPLAATVALAAGLGFLLGQGTAGDPGAGLADLRTAAAALENSPTGEVLDLADGSRAAVLASFETATGPCRQFQLRNAGGEVWESLGCRTAEGWHIALVLPQAAVGTYVPAEGAPSGALDAYLAALDASPPLGAEAEAARMRAGWSAAPGG